MRKMMLSIIGCAILSATAAVPQAHEYLARQEMQADVLHLADPLSVGRPDEAVKVMAGLDLTLAAPTIPDLAPAAFSPDTAAVIDMVDIRLLLTRIAVQAGAKDHAGLIRAQGNRSHDVILLRGGSVTLDDFATLAEAGPARDFVTRTLDGVVLTRPLAVWEDAGLHLAAGDTLILNRPDGSFVVNLGWVDVKGGTIRGSSGNNPAEPPFRPFVLTAGQGHLTAQGAIFDRLGSATAVVFGGIAVVNSELVETHLVSTIVDSRIIDVASVAMVATKAPAVVGNRFEGAAGTALLLSRASGAIVAGNSFTALSGPRAIRVTAGSSQVLISGNLLYRGPRIGILIDGESTAVTLSGNVVLNSATSGVTVRSATCVHITDNLIAMSGGTGISLADTEGIGIGANAILFNHGSGVLVRDQAGSATVRLTGNVIAGNRDGLRGATAGRVVLEGNRLDGQLPRVFAGDLAPLTVEWLRNRRDAVPARKTADAQAPCDNGEPG